MELSRLFIGPVEATISKQLNEHGVRWLHLNLGAVLHVSILALSLQTLVHEL